MSGNTRDKIAFCNNAVRQLQPPLRLWPTLTQMPQFLRKSKTLPRLFATGSAMKRARDFSL
ncbi:hypothetical protein F2Q68_00025502 [Brassica cretica]|uniref:Uncharacterized protein n=1 Tax=Brassica cretica TaxID=69181 RepID=A0A8S9IAS3_BRACR|nr:hypothetical protein F2Q68_00025502 [Brassica cretica]